MLTSISNFLVKNKPEKFIQAFMASSVSDYEALTYLITKFSSYFNRGIKVAANDIDLLNTISYNLFLCVKIILKLISQQTAATSAFLLKLVEDIKYIFKFLKILINLVYNISDTFILIKVLIYVLNANSDIFPQTLTLTDLEILQIKNTEGISQDLILGISSGETDLFMLFNQQIDKINILVSEMGKDISIREANLSLLANNGVETTNSSVDVSDLDSLLLILGSSFTDMYRGADPLIINIKSDEPITPQIVFNDLDKRKKYMDYFDTPLSEIMKNLKKNKPETNGTGFQ